MNNHIRLLCLLAAVIVVTSACFLPGVNAVQTDLSAQTVAAQTVVAAVVQTQLAELTIGAPTPQADSACHPARSSHPVARTYLDFDFDIDA